MKRAIRTSAAPVILAWTLLTGCSPAPTVVSTTVLNRPTDVAFLCVGTVDRDPASSDDPLVVTGRPMYACHPIDSGKPPAPAEGTRTFAFMPNSASGDLSVVDADRWRVVDLVAANSGYTRLPLGALPEQISATTDGCRLVTANRGSCDLSLIDPAALLAPIFQSALGNVAVPDRYPAQSLVVRRGDGTPLLSAPQEAVFLPNDTSALLPREGDGSFAPVTADQMCGPDGAGSASWRAVVTYPSCDLIAVVDLPSARIVDSVKVRGDGTVTRDGAGLMPECPAECGAGVGATPAAPESRPGSIVVEPSGRRAYVALATAIAGDVAAMSFEIAQDGTLGLPAAPIALQAAPGASRVRLSVEPYRYFNPGRLDYPGKFVDRSEASDRRYLYVIARDGTLRVVDIFDPAAPRECETNADPLAPGATPPDPTARCLPVGPTQPPRPFDSGPGIRFNSLPPYNSLIPVDVAAADIRPPSGTDDPSQASVNGGYAWVLVSSGDVFLVNIDPVRRQFFYVEGQDTDGDGIQETFLTNDPLALQPDQGPHQEPPPLPNTLRDRNQIAYRSGMEAGSGPPRVDVPPGTLTTGPFVESFWTKGSDADATALDTTFRETQFFFPDRYAVRPQTWSIRWQGTLMSSPAGQLSATDGVESPVLTGGGFCGAGVIAGDSVTLAGCTADRQCGPGRVCRVEPTLDEVPGGLNVTGLCFDPTLATSRAETCAAFLRTPRRYEIVAATNEQLTIKPHVDEVVFSSLDTCRDSEHQCADPADPEPATCCTDPENPGRCRPANCPNPLDPTTRGFECVDVPGGRARCLNRCEDDTACRRGRLCMRSGPDQGFCVDAPPVAFSDVTNCFSELVPYEVAVGRAFLVVGSQTGSLESARMTPERVCVPWTAADGHDSRLVARIPLAAADPASITCSDLPAPFDADSTQFNNVVAAQLGSNPALGADPNVAAFKLASVVRTPRSPNPCLFAGGRQMNDSIPPGANDGDPRKQVTHVRAVFRNTEVAFVLTNLDRAPASELDIRFDVHGGFRPQVVRYPSTVEISMPSRLVVGPIDSQAAMSTAGNEVPYLFVVDQRRLGRGVAGGAVRGQLLRINPLGQFTDGTEPIYQDYQTSGNLFPLQ